MNEPHHLDKTAQVSLNSLNSDILLVVFSFVDPIDIIHVRKTCKFLHSVTKHPILWIKWLNNIMTQYNLFSLTYEVERMSVLELERAVLLPSKLLGLSEESMDAPITPFGCRVITNPLDANDPPTEGVLHRYREENIDEFILIPGGRFLFTISKKYDEKTYIKLWDLGQPGTGQSRINLLSLLHGQERIHTTAATPDGLGIRVITSSSSRRGEYAIKVYQIFPLSPNPCFEEIAGINLSEYIRSINVSGNRIVCSTCAAPAGFITISELAPGFILIWDFVANTSTVFKPDIPLPQEFCLWGNQLITFHSNSLFTWSIPPLKSHAPQFKSTMPASAPTWTSVYSDWSEGRSDAVSVMLRPQTGWIDADSSPQYLIVASLLGADDIQYAIYQVDKSWIKDDSKPSANSSVDVFKPPAPRHKSNLNLVGFGEEYRMWHTPASPQTSNKDVFLTLGCTASIIMTAMPLPKPESELTASDPRLCCFSIGRLDCESMQFCLATGRGCAISRHGDYEVRVFDYMCRDK